MTVGRIAVVGLVLAVLGGAWLAAGLTGDDDRTGPVEALMLEKARQQEPVALVDTDEDDGHAAGGPDPSGDGARRGTDGRAAAARAGGVDRDGAAPGGRGTGSSVEGRLRRELAQARERAETLRRQLASERRRDDTDDTGVRSGARAGGAQIVRPAPAPAPPPRRAPSRADTSAGGSDT